ncbi:hypothetical protein KW785_03550, partial [Candidatus Parcubacteria bacterium]|nr:hypothetical protein [Candidatus Parcubacteria bacterium]
MHVMKSFGKKGAPLLLLGDIFFFIVSLWLSLFLRSFSPPSLEVLSAHLVPFGLLFVAWILVFYIAGLYDRQTSILRSRLPATLFNTQVANSILAVLFFYLIPFFGITPKTLLFIDLVVTFFVTLGWRMYGHPFITTREPEKAMLIGSGEEMKELLEEVNGNPLHNISFVTSVDLERTGADGFWDEIVSRINAEGVSIVAIDLMHTQVAPVLPHLYNLIFSKVRFIDMHKVYEDIFNRVPLSLLRYNWFLENISTQPQTIYDGMKRLMDIFIALVLGILSIIIYPFVYIAIKLDDLYSS